MRDPLYFNRLIIRLEEATEHIKSLYSKMRNETDDWQQQELQQAIVLLDTGLRKTKQEIRRQIDEKVR